MKLFKSKWTKWETISTANIGEGGLYILQARKHRNGKVQVRVEHNSYAYGCEAPTPEQLANIKFWTNDICNS